MLQYPTESKGKAFDNQKKHYGSKDMRKEKLGIMFALVGGLLMGISLYVIYLSFAYPN